MTETVELLKRLSLIESKLGQLFGTVNLGEYSQDQDVPYWLAQVINPANKVSFLQQQLLQQQLLQQQLMQYGSAQNLAFSQQTPQATAFASGSPISNLASLGNIAGSGAIASSYTNQGSTAQPLTTSHLTSLAQVLDQQMFIQSGIVTAIQLIAQSKLAKDNHQATQLSRLADDIIDNWCGTKAPGIFPPRPKFVDVIRQVTQFAEQLSDDSIMREAAFDLSKRILERGVTTSANGPLKERAMAGSAS